MQKTIKDLAVFLQMLLPPKIPEAFAIDAMFYDISDEADIRKGISAFRDFIYSFYSRLIAEGDTHDRPKKTAHAFTDNTSIAASYPFVNNLKVILVNIGLHGALSEKRDSLLLESVQSIFTENPISNVKISDVKKIECLRFLVDCGFRIGGMDLNVKKPDLSAHIPLEISYPENPVMLTGLKVMAVAQRDLKDLGLSNIQDVFLRCDYRALANKDIDVFSALKDMADPLPSDVKKFVLKLHQSYVSKGYKCVLNITNLYVRFTYFCRSKELWRLNISLNNGYNIGIKATNTHKYAETIEKFPVWLQEKIAEGYGCGKKRGKSDSCDGGCRGYRVPLDDSFMEISNVIETWIDKEVSCLHGK